MEKPLLVALHRAHRASRTRPIRSNQFKSNQSNQCINESVKINGLFGLGWRATNGKTRGRRATTPGGANTQEWCSRMLRKMARRAQEAARQDGRARARLARHEQAATPHGPEFPHDAATPSGRHNSHPPRFSVRTARQTSTCSTWMTPCSRRNAKARVPFWTNPRLHLCPTTQRASGTPDQSYALVPSICCPPNLGRARALIIGQTLED